MELESRESKMVKRLACDKCGSSNANTLYDDGHLYCYVCNTWERGDGEKPMGYVHDESDFQTESKGIKDSVLTFQGEVIDPPKRGIRHL